MILEYLVPGARRRTHTAGTTEASLLGLLDVGNHDTKIQKRTFEVNPDIASVMGRLPTGNSLASLWTGQKKARGQQLEE
jgi:hypothetical protein